MPFSYKQNGQLIHARMSGSANEDMDLPDARQLNLEKISEMRVDFEGVTFINSTATANWIKLMRDILKIKPSIKFEFVNCPSIIIDQLNWVADFLPKGGKVSSFYLPIFCSQCDRSFEVLFTPDQVRNREESELIDNVQSVDCKDFPYCKKKLSVDVVLERHFKFLK